VWLDGWKHNREEVLLRVGHKRGDQDS
jgi:hypothetical protein